MVCALTVINIKPSKREIVHTAGDLSYLQKTKLLFILEKRSN